MLHVKQGHDADAYLLGETSPNGFWYFFLVALGLKTPLALVFLMIIGVLILLLDCTSVETAGVLAFTFGILLSTMPSRLNIGVRHVLPVYSSLSIAAHRRRPEDHRGPLAGERPVAIARVVECRADRLERQQMERLDRRQARRRHAVAERVEGDLGDEPAPLRGDLVGRLRVGVVSRAASPSGRAGPR